MTTASDKAKALPTRDEQPGFVRGRDRYDRRRCDYCGMWLGVNVRAQHYRAKHYVVRPEPGPTCSRCGGDGIDPDSRDCRCDCCGGTGVEYTD